MSTSTLTKAEIVDSIYEKSERNRAEVKGQVEVMLDIMKEAVKKDHSLLISGFGKFEAYEKDARKGRNPQTSESIILAERKVVVFRISRKLRAELNPQLQSSQGFLWSADSWWLRLHPGWRKPRSAPASRLFRPLLRG